MLYCAQYWLKELQKSMSKCNRYSDITRILLKTALNILQSICQTAHSARVLVLDAARKYRPMSACALPVLKSIF